MANFYASYSPQATSGGGGGSGTVTSVDVSGGATGLTTSGGPVTTSGVITFAGTLALTHGGTGQVTAPAAFAALSPLTTVGDLIYEGAGPAPARLAIGAAAQVLTVSGGVPVWAAPATSGTVTSVDVSGGTTGLTTSGGPITSSGVITLAGTLAVLNGGTGVTTSTGTGSVVLNTTPTFAGLSSTAVMLMAEGTPGAGGGYAFVEAANDTGMFSPGDGDIAFYANGVDSVHIKPAGLSLLDGSEGTPSLAFQSTPNTGLFLDGSGNVSFTKLGLHRLAVGEGLTFPANFAPVDNEGTITQHAFQTSLNPLVNVTTGSARNLIQLEQNIGTDDSGFSVDSAAGLQVNLNSRNKSSWNNLTPFSVNSQIGNGTDAQTGTNLAMASISGNIGNAASVNSYQALQLGLNAPAGSTVGTYIGINTNAQIDAATNYTGLHVGDNLGTISNSANAIDVTTNVSGSVSQFHGVNLSGNIASITGGYDGFHAAHNLTLTGGAVVFSDTNQVTAMTAGSSYNPINISPGIGTMSGGYTTLRSFPTIGTGNGITVFEDGTLVTGSAVNYLGLNIHPSLTGMTGDVNGIIFQPSGATATNATGLNIDMTGITTGGSKTAITTNGAPVNINNANFNVNTGEMHINAPTQAFVNVGNPTPVNNINSNFVAPANTVVASADGFGFSPISNVTLGHDSHITSGGLRLGTASLGMISLMTLDDSSDIQDVGGSFVAQILTGGTGAGGVVTNVYGYRYVGGNGGSPSSILNARAYLADDPLGAPGTNSWGFYSKASYENYFGKSLKVGGAPNGTNDKVTNSSVGLEIEGTAFYPQPMTTATRNALTALQGFVINNSTTGFLERYDGAAWVNVATGGTVTSVDVSGGTTGLTTSGGPVTTSGTITLAGTLAVANGGTGVTSSTGTGSVVLNTSPSLVTPDLGTPSAAVLTSATGLPLTTGVTGVLPIANGGTNAATAANAFINLSPLTTVGDLIYEGAGPAPARLAIGAAGQILTVSGGLPVWAAPATSGTVTSVSVVSANGLAGTVATATTTPAITLSTTITGILQGNGTAISAAATTGSGSVVLATSPTLVTPALGTPTSLVLTSATGLPLTTGVTGVLPIANGGTNAATKAGAFDSLSPMTTAGDLIYGGAAGTGTRLAAGTAGQLLAGGTTPAWTTTLTKTVAGDGLQLITDDQTNQSTLLLKAGHTTTSSRNVWVDFQTTETTPQRWRAGMIGSKDFLISDTTGAANMISIAVGGTSGVNILGSTDGTVAAAGSVGEIFHAEQTTQQAFTTTSGQFFAVPGLTFTLNKGFYLMSGNLQVDQVLGVLTGASIAIDTSNGTVAPSPRAIGVNEIALGAVFAGSTGGAIAMYYVNVTSNNTPYYLKAEANWSGSAPAARGSLIAMRIF